MTKTLLIHAASHLDHINHLPPQDMGLVLAQAFLAWEDQQDLSPTGPWSIQFEVPFELNCDLVGPKLGQDPIPESEVSYKIRNGRKCASRCVSRQPSKTKKVTMIVGPHDDHPFVVYTIFAGPSAPREPGDPSIESWKEIQESRDFWADHALIG